MAWQYIAFDSNGDLKPGEEKSFPETGSVFLAFDALQWRVVIGYRERNGIMSMLNPHVCDDCELVAFAPLTEITEPIEERIKATSPDRDWKNYPCYVTDTEAINLCRETL